MLITILAAAAAKPSPYGLGPALKDGGLISQTVFGILVIMSVSSFYILFSKLFEQEKIKRQAKRVRQQLLAVEQRCVRVRPSSRRTRLTSSSSTTASPRRTSTLA